MSGIIDLFVPREKKFFEYLGKQLILLEDCVKKLDALKVKKFNYRKLQGNLEFVQEKSDQADLVSSETIGLLHKTFITPIDREEIKSLSTSINFMIDSAEKIIATVYYFKMEKLDLDFLRQIKILQESVEILKLIFKEPLSQKKNKGHIEKLKKLERDADSIYRKAIGELFNNGYSPIEVIKRKELYEITEDAVDDAKHIADLMETVLINNS